MKNLLLFAVLLTLPLLLGGCGGDKKEPVAEVKPEESVAETKPELEGVNKDELEKRESIWYFKDSETSYTGKIFSLYENGQKHVEGNYKDGKPDGLAVRWHENGQKKFEGNWKGGKRYGLHMGWHENGQKHYEGNWKNGKQDGLFVDWHENGQKSYETTFKDDKRDGLLTKWHENGKKKAERNWKDGKLVEGSEKYWNSKGEIVDSEEEAEAE